MTECGEPFGTNSTTECLDGAADLLIVIRERFSHKRLFKLPSPLLSSFEDGSLAWKDSTMCSYSFHKYFLST